MSTSNVLLMPILFIIFITPVFAQELFIPLQRGNLCITKNTDEIIEVRNNRTGYTHYKSLQSTGFSSNDIPTLTIDFRTLDYSLYDWKYRPLTSFNAGIETDDFEFVAYDFNKNGRNEIILQNQSYQSPHRFLGVGIYELGSDSVMKKLYDFPDSLGRGGDTFGDIDNNGEMEILIHPGRELNNYNCDSAVFYTQLKPTNLPIKPFAIFDSLSHFESIAISRLRNLDDEPNLELLYRIQKRNTNGTFNEIARFNNVSHKFDIVYSKKLPIYTQGYAFGDFDLDGKQNFSNGGIDGRFFMFEYQGGNNWTFCTGSTEIGLFEKIIL